MLLFYRKKFYVFCVGLNKFELIILKKKCFNLNKKFVVNWVYSKKKNRKC